MTRHPRPLAALALIVLLGSGCGGSAPTQTQTQAGVAANAGAGQDKAVKFAECMRAHGVPHFPDPDAKGDFVFGVDVTPAVFGKAVAACKALEPPGALSGKRSPKQQSDALTFAACIRRNGVADFPDPVNGDPLVDTTKIPSSNRPGGMTILNAAMQRCRPLLKLAAGGQR